MERLRALCADISDLGHATALLSWDQETYMPPAGAEARGRQMGTLGRLAHEMGTSAEMGRLLDELRPAVASLDPDSFDARLVARAARDYEKAVCVPAALVVEAARVSSLAIPAWVQARAESRFEIFRPHLEKTLDIARWFASCFPSAAHPYDALVDPYEEGMTTATLRSLFAPLRERQVALIRRIASAPPIDDSCLHQPFDVKEQWDFGMEVVAAFGLDPQRSRQDQSAHPFTIGIAFDDARITTRMNPTSLGEGLFSTLHECGHALYELGRSRDLEGTPLEAATSLGIHETQSRLWENLVGRSLPFWRHFYPRLVRRFPQLASVDLATFYGAINRVTPSLIRTEADEATYNLHVMLRMDIEIALVEGSLAVKDLPDAWNAGMKDYLGTEPPDDAHGVLQDIHWAHGSIGYFPTYAIGNIVAAQLWETMTLAIPDIETQIEAGRFEALLGWLRTNVHEPGRTFTPQELIRRVTGSGIDAVPYLRSLETKFGALYGV